jgi:hypothetical protein
MSHLSAFDGPLGFVTLHPLFTIGPVLLASFWVALAARRKPAPNPVRHRR